MVNIFTNSISPFTSTYSTVTNGNNFLKIHHKEPIFNSNKWKQFPKNSSQRTNANLKSMLFSVYNPWQSF